MVKNILRVKNNQRVAKDKKSGKKKPLLRTILQSSRTYLLIPIIPRLLLSALRFAQPFLVANVVTWARAKESSKNIGYGLIGAFAFVYIGLAVSNGKFSWTDAVLIY